MSKRVFDTVLASVVLILTLPFAVIVALAIKLDSPGSVLYRSVRVGRNKTLFGMWKFRTMVQDADAQGPLVTSGGDPRVTRAGAWLRKTKLDEIPAFVNVLLGDMSIVGPRPENPRSALLYTPEQQRVFDVRPGITSPASIRYRHEEAVLARMGDLESAYRIVLQDKLRLDLEYIEKRSIWLDMKLVARTAAAVFERDAAHA